METRTLGRTGFAVTEIGFGAWAIGGRGYGDVTEADAYAALETYLAAGGNLVDTARRYGQSERLIGDFMQRTGVRDRVFIASKTHQTDAEAIRAELEKSLRLLQTDTIDLYYLHSPPDDPGDMRRVLDVYDGLKEEGKIRATGASIRGPNVTPGTVDLCRQYIRSGRVDALQVIYSVFRQMNGEMFAEAQAAGVGIVARTALESGFLTGKYRPGHSFGEGDHRRRWGAARLSRILERVAALEQSVVQPPYESLAQAAIRFALSAGEVSTVIVGARSSAQVRDNVGAGALPPLDAGLVQALREAFQGMEADFNTGA